MNLLPRADDTPTSPESLPLRLFSTNRTPRLLVPYGFAALFGLAMVGLSLWMLYDVYRWLVGVKAVAPQGVMIFVIPAFLLLGGLVAAFSLSIVFRPGSIYAAVYADRIRYGDGFLNRDVPLADIAAADCETDHDNPPRVYLYLNTGKRREVFAITISPEQQRNEFIDLVNELAEKQRR